jgi:hypothetical protein
VLLVLEHLQLCFPRLRFSGPQLFRDPPLNEVVVASIQLPGKHAISGVIWIWLDHVTEKVCETLLAGVRVLAAVWLVVVWRGRAVGAPAVRIFWCETGGAI